MGDAERCREAGGTHTNLQGIGLLRSGSLGPERPDSCQFGLVRRLVAVEPSVAAVGMFVKGCRLNHRMQGAV